jgi:hypothetical protein
MINVEQTIISQYNPESTIYQLIQGMNENIDPRADIDAFYDFVFNVETAQGFGLDIWGRIVDISRYLTIPNNVEYFGFVEQNQAAQEFVYPFDEMPFYSGEEPATQTYRLSDDAYRRLILLKAMANIASTNARSINQILQNLFQDRGRCYVNDLGSMSMRYTFEFILTKYEVAIITQSGALPRPAGVGALVANISLPVFGFSESTGCTPFGEGTFIKEGSIYAAR